MSAREELYAFGMAGRYHSPHNSELCSERIDAFKAEVLREAAEKLRGASPFGRGPCVIGRAADYRCDSEYCESCTIKNLIDLIDPDKEGS